jgi:hypothetical protein
LVVCDFSLEMYQSRPAQQGEEYISNKFPTGTVGFVSPGDKSIAICMACDSELKLSRIPPKVQTMAGVGDSEVVTFTRIERPSAESLGALLRAFQRFSDDARYHRDAVRFRNGKVVSLQTLGPRVTAWLLPQRLVTPLPVREKREAELV